MVQSCKYILHMIFHFLCSSLLYCKSTVYNTHKLQYGFQSKVKVIHGFLTAWGVGDPSPCIAQRSTVLKTNLDWVWCPSALMFSDLNLPLFLSLILTAGFLLLFLFSFLTVPQPHGLCDLSFLTRDWIQSLSRVLIIVPPRNSLQIFFYLLVSFKCWNPPDLVVLVRSP